MPNRILRDGILTSERVSSLNWPEEVFYRRLISVVDDFGRFYANPSLIRAACYPLHLDKVSDSDIDKWLLVTEKAGLVRVYSAQDGKRYLELMDFRQQVRSKKSKYPSPDGDCIADATHPISNAHLDVDVDVDVKRGRFTPPTLKEVSEYCEERGNDINPQSFLDHYEANGWMRGKNKVKDWKACVRTWESNRKPVNSEEYVPSV